ncbi:MAG: exonuclease SbcCD subunit D C-terminal domain-containing protein [Microthrixaceae bacterium]|nr:exonuclease SbcCD subunit D C-terminal domain-containing protein [Microthrixaceae bacterium]
MIGGTGRSPGVVVRAVLLHRTRSPAPPQSVSAPHIRYSGTPLAYSFSEDHPKSVVILEMDPTGAVEVAVEPVGVGRGARTITGEMAELLDPGFAPDAGDCFVRAVVTDRDTVLDAKARLAELYPHVVEVRLQPLGQPAATDGPSIESPALGALEAAEEFWVAAEGSAAPSEITELLTEAVTHAGNLEAGVL